jgi:hypothetical protein
METVNEPQPEISLAERTAALHFALESESLCRSDRLKSMLRFVCEAEFAGEQHRLTEYEIAVSALGRREDFSPSEDSTVRSRAFELRQKLERLYSVEAPESCIRIDLPKGSYRPRFYRHKPLAVVSAPSIDSADAAQVSTQPIAPDQPGKVRVNPRWAVPLFCFALGVGLTALLVALTMSFRHSGIFPRAENSAWTPDLRLFWRPILEGSKPVLVAYETRLFVSVGPLVVRDPNIESIQDVESSAPIMQVKKLFHAQEVYEARRYTDFSVVNAAFSIAQLLSTTGIPLKAERTDEMTSEQIASSNLILLGKPGAFDNLKQVPIVGANFVYDSFRNIRNLHPRAGERDLYQRGGSSAQSGGVSQEFALITLTPGPSRGQHVLNIVSAESELFRPLGAYLTDPGYMQDLVRHLRLANGGLPEAFEVLVRIDMRGPRPLRIAYVAHRVLPVAQ